MKNTTGKVLSTMLALALAFILLPQTAFAYLSITIMPILSTPNTVSGYDYIFSVGDTINLRFQGQPSTPTQSAPSYTGTLPAGIGIADLNLGGRQFSLAGTCTAATSGPLLATLSFTSDDGTTATRDITITVNKAAPTMSANDDTAVLGAAKTVSATLAGAWLASGDSMIFTASSGTVSVQASATANGDIGFDLSAADIDTLGLGAHSFTITQTGETGNAATNNDTVTDASLSLTISSAPPPPPPPPTPPAPQPSPSPTPTPAFSDGDTLAPGSSSAAPAGNSSFCLGNSGSAPVTVIIDNVPYTITPRAENTCFEVFASETGRALILDSGTADIGTPMPNAALLEARNGDLVMNEGNATIRATVDPNCTSTRITVLEGKVDAPEWITSPMPSTGCPEDALTPKQGSFMVGDGKLACNPSALSIKGTWAKLTVQHTQSVAAGQQLFAVAGHPVYGWYQHNGQGWMPLSDPFLPFSTATQTGSTTSMPVERLDVRPILGTELYVGNGKDGEEMMRNGRYCGAFKVAP